MKRNNLAGISRVTFHNDKDFDPNLCENGGAYSFWDTYSRVDTGWEVEYHTSSDMDFCPVCGCFDDHLHYEEDEIFYECGDFEIITEEDLLQRIAEYVETDDCYITYE